MPGTVAAVATAAAAPLLYRAAMRRAPGLPGAAAGFVACNAAGAALLLGYTAARDARRARAADATWAGPSLEALRGWGTYLSLAVPALAAIAAEWLAYEVVIMLAGLLPDAEVAVGCMGLLFQLSALAYMGAMALASAVNTRVANQLGAGRARGARASFVVGAAAALALQCAMCAAGLLLGRRAVRLLASSGAVVDVAARAMPVLSLTFVGDGVNAVLQGVLRGAGRQALGAALNLGAYWGVGVPLAALLAFRGPRLGVLGFWLGLLITTTAQALVQLLVVLRFDWELEVARARALVGADGNGGGGGGGDPTELDLDDAEAGGGSGGGADAPRSGGGDRGGARAAAAAAAAKEGKKKTLPRDEERRPLLLDTAASLASSRAASFGGAVAPDVGASRAESAVELPRLPSVAERAAAAGYAAAAAAEADRADARRRDQGGSGSGGGGGGSSSGQGGGGGAGGSDAPREERDFL